MKYFCFRFDVDTTKCIKEGVPNLIRLSKKLDLPFTFFINMGRGTSRWSLIKKKLSFGSKLIAKTAPKLSNLKKLGLWDYLLMALINPQVGNSYPDIIKSLKKAGHEVGLHGGLNHGEWQNESHNWEKQKFVNEITPALDSLTKFLGEKPMGFSSPGWCGSKDLNTILESLDFHYVADAHGENLEKITFAQNDSKLLQIPTNILGDGGVAYLENLRARNMNDNTILKEFSSKLDKQFFAVLYDHPYYAGIQELPLLERMIDLVRSKGFQIVTLKTLVEKRSFQSNS
ncbi:MAG: polysaccharide deacetylase family protein [Nitrospinota bacterium]|nr:polysaccharide deacetylase family protein [Nitrospinota bacterium]